MKTEYTARELFWELRVLRGRFERVILCPVRGDAQPEQSELCRTVTVDGLRYCVHMSGAKEKYAK